ncbi:MAG: hypothetical protein GX636_04985 [Actinomycetales bacterium]|nr:hypothetical protein [Actinomycetales bacterium]
MRYVCGRKAASRVALAASLAVLTAGAATVATVRPADSQVFPGPAIVTVAETSFLSAPEPILPPALLPPPAPAPTPADVVRETGSWFAHGYTLDLRDDGTGDFAVWMGAFDGTRIALRLIPAPGPATVAEVQFVETIGQGALSPDAVPGVGGLVTISFGDPVRTAHVEWTAGADRLQADLCPSVGLDAAAMEILRCGA